MGFRKRSIWASIVAGVLCAAAPTGAEAQTVQVLVYNNAKVKDSVLTQSGREVVRIFRAAGISLNWVNCTGRGESGACVVELHGPELILHIVPKGKVSTDSVYGEAFLASDGAGKYADVFYDRVEGAERDFGLSPSMLLGAVSAHEIGHLLLGLKAHSWTGIMAPVWRKESFQELQMGRLFFTREQTAQLRARTEDEASRTADHLSRKGSHMEGRNGNP